MLDLDDVLPVLGPQEPGHSTTDQVAGRLADATGERALLLLRRGTGFRPLDLVVVSSSGVHVLAVADVIGRGAVGVTHRGTLVVGGRRRPDLTEAALRGAEEVAAFLGDVPVHARVCLVESDLPHVMIVGGVTVDDEAGVLSAVRATGPLDPDDVVRVHALLDEALR